MNSFIKKTNKQQPSISSRIWSSLTASRKNFAGVFDRSKIEDSWFEELEDSLICTDIGPKLATQLTGLLKEKVRSEKITNKELVKERLIELINCRLENLKTNTSFNNHPTVILFVGVNGSGKTTSIGKLAHRFRKNHKKILFSAADTFRAAAQEQLFHWASENKIDVISQKNADPSAIAFDSTKAAIARDIDILMIDTAGRLPNQKHLMEELKKMKKVISKALPNAPHHIWITIDAGNGQTVLDQVEGFDDSLGLTGIILTKLDGSAKAGMLIGLNEKFRIPVRYVGLGEKIEDISEFNPKDCAQGLIGYQEIS